MAYYYRIEDRIIELPAEKEDKLGAEKRVEVPLAVLCKEEAVENTFLQSLGYPVTAVSYPVHFCKAEAHMHFLYGTYLSPVMEKKRKQFTFVLDPHHLYMVEEGEMVKNILCRLKKTYQKKGGTGSVWVEFMELLLADDLEKLSGLEVRLTHLEDEVLSGNISRFDQKLIRCRKEILRYSHYYLQLQDVTDVLQKNDLKIFSGEDLAGIRRLREKIGRLHQEARMLREYSTQVREVYQAQIEIRQNKIMKSLTIVTAIFLPLTLIAGWYGMNFTYMPELHWKYGYPAVMGLSAVTVLSSLALCYKKHFFH